MASCCVGILTGGLRPANPQLFFLPRVFDFIGRFLVFREPFTCHDGNAKFMSMIAFLSPASNPLFTGTNGVGKSLSVGMMLLLAVLMVTPGYADDNAGQGWYEEALGKYRNREYKDAKRLAQLALAKQPRHLAGRVLLGQIRLKLGNAPTAEKELRNARRYGADPDLVSVPLAESYFALGKYDQLLRELRADGLSLGPQVQLMALRGKAMLEQRDVQAAEVEFNAIVKLDPKAAEGYLGLAGIALLKGDTTLAESLVDQALLASPEHPDALSRSGELYWSYSDFDQALAAFDRALLNDPDHIGARLARAALLLSMNREALALDDIETVLIRVPNDAKAIYLKARVLTRLGEQKQANELLLTAQTMLEALDDNYVHNHVPSLLLLGLVGIHEKNYQSAARYLARVNELVPNHVGGNKLYARALIRIGQTVTASAVLDRLSKQRPNDAAVFALYAELYTKDKRLASAKEMLQRAIQLAPERADLQLKMGKLEAAMGNKAAGVKTISKAVELDPSDYRKGIALATELLRSSRTTKTLEITTELLKRRPKDINVLNLMGAVLIARGEFEKARKPLLQALAIAPGTAVVQLNLARIDAKQGRHSDVIKRLQNLLRKHPSEVEAMLQLAKSLKVEGDTKQAIRWLEEVRSLKPDHSKGMLELVKLYRQQGKMDLATERMREIEARKPGNPRVLTMAAEIEREMGNKARAKVVTRKLSQAAASAGSVDWLIKAGKQQIKNKDLEAARWSFLQAVTKSPRNLRAKLELTKVEMQLGHLDKAMKWAQQIRAIHPKLAIGERLLGDILLKQGEFEKAVDQFRGGRDKEKSSALTTRLYWAMRKSGDVVGSDKLLNDWLSTHPGDLKAQRLMIAGMIIRQKWKRAEDQINSLLKERPGDPEALNNLAWVYFKVGNKKALPIAMQALAKAPGRSELLDTVGWLLVHDKQPRKALKYLRDAHSRNTLDYRVRYHIAEALNDLGRKKEAVSELKAALVSGRWFDGKTHAELLLADLTGKGKSKSTKPVVEKVTP